MFVITPNVVNSCKKKGGVYSTPLERLTSRFNVKSSYQGHVEVLAVIE